jgi:hypothetical protein
LLYVEAEAVVQGGKSTISELIWRAFAEQPGPILGFTVLLSGLVFFLLGHFVWQSSDKYDEIRKA